MITLGIIGAIGLASSGMLFWGACALIPLVLHLLKRHRPQVIDWAVIELLRKVVEHQTRRVRIEQLLLLIMRMLICTLLAVALARPFLSTSSNTMQVDLVAEPRLWIIVIDSSYSMGYRHESTTRFDTAKARAAEIVSASNLGDSFALVRLGKPSQSMISRVTFDRAAVSKQLDELQLQDTGADLASCLHSIDEIVQNARRVAMDPRRIHIVVLTDLGKDTWEPATVGSLFQRLSRLAANHQLSFESVATGTPANVAVTETSASRTRGEFQGRLRIDASISNFGSAIVNRMPVQFLVDGQTTHSEIIDLGIGQTRAVQADIPHANSAQTVVAVTIPNDRLDVDNRRDVIVSKQKQTRVLCVEGRAGGARLVSLALSPTGKASTEVEIQTISSIELSSQELSNWHAVLLSGVKEISKSEASRLRQFVMQGGGLLHLFGSETVSESWNRMSKSNTHDLLGFQLTEPSAEQDWRIDPLKYASPVVAPFADFLDAGLLTTPIFRYWRIQPHRGQELTIDLAIQNSGPLVVRRKLGRGWSASWLSAPETGQSSLDTSRPAWNAIATWPSFVPLMQQLMEAITSSETESCNVLVGQPISGTLGVVASDAKMRVVGPDGEEGPVDSLETADDGSVTWTHGRTSQRGVYKFLRDNAVATQAVANIDPIESSLESIGAGRLPKSDSTLTEGGIDHTAIDLSAEKQDRIAQMLLVALLAVLVAESCLAWSMGRRLA